MKKIILLLMAAITMLAVEARTYKIEDIPNVHLNDRTRFLSNPDGIISQQAQSQADSVMNRLRQDTSVEMVAVIVDDIVGGDIDSYANNLFNLWGLGKKDNNNGVLLLVARDLRKAVIRTGPGVEGVLTDAACGRILRQEMFPAFKQGDFDGGITASINAIAARLGDPTNADELRSSLEDADNNTSSISPLKTYLLISVIVTIIIAIIIAIKLFSMRSKSPYDKYSSFESWKAPMLILTFGGLGIPLVVTLPLLLMLQYWRNRPRRCPNCGHKMQKVDEVHDNDFLTPAQDCEERIGSVDYDVWHCPNCGETDIFPFVNHSMPLVECDYCHARTAKLSGDRIIAQPTTAHTGTGEKEFTCLNCHHVTRKKYTIAKLAPIVVVPMGGGRGGGFGGGGSIGGGFGGGFTGGGGASGGW